MKKIEKGSMYYTNLKREEYYNKPIVIIQNTKYEDEDDFILVAPIIINNKKDKPTHVHVCQLENTRKDSYIILEKIQPIKVGELHGYIGKLNKEQLEEINFLLRILFEI